MPLLTSDQVREQLNALLTQHAPVTITFALDSYAVDAPRLICCAIGDVTSSSPGASHSGVGEDAATALHAALAAWGAI